MDSRRRCNLTIFMTEFTEFAFDEYLENSKVFSLVYRDGDRVVRVIENKKDKIVVIKMNFDDDDLEDYLMKVVNGKDPRSLGAMSFFSENN